MLSKAVSYPYDKMPTYASSSDRLVTASRRVRVSSFSEQECGLIPLDATSKPQARLLEALLGSVARRRALNQRLGDIRLRCINELRMFTKSLSVMVRSCSLGVLQEKFAASSTLPLPL